MDLPRRARRARRNTEHKSFEILFKFFLRALRVLRGVFLTHLSRAFLASVDRLLEDAPSRSVSRKGAKLAKDGKMTFASSAPWRGLPIKQRWIYHEVHEEHEEIQNTNHSKFSSNTSFVLFVCFVVFS